MDVYNTIASWTGWVPLMALLLLAGGWSYWMLNKHIELLKEKIAGLEKENANIKENTPDVLAQRLANRHKLLTEELERLNADHRANQEAFEVKKAELEGLRNEINYFDWQLSEAQDLLSENGFVCPHCNSPLAVKEYHIDLVEYDGRELDVEHEHIVYECGYELADGKVLEDCPQRFKPEDYQDVPE